MRENGLYYLMQLADVYGINVRQQYLDNTMVHHNIGEMVDMLSFLGNRTYGDLSDFICGGFRWIGTPEGGEYWCSIYSGDSIRDICLIKSKQIRWSMGKFTME